MLGLALHSLLDGVALAAAVAGESAQHGRVGLAGLAVFLVVVLHKPFDSLTLAASVTEAVALWTETEISRLRADSVIPVGEGRFLLIGSRVITQPPYDGPKRMEVVWFGAEDESTRRRGARH